jgi:hypothetical protein
MIQGSGDHTLRFRFDTSFIEEDTANMWGVHYQVPIIIEFKFIAPHFIGTSRVRLGAPLPTAGGGLTACSGPRRTSSSAPRAT